MGEMRWKKASWIHNTNIYEVNLRQYTSEGTINAFIKELPRLRDMGIHCLWFMPVTPISTVNRKGSMGSYYACSDYRSVSPEFGSLDDFKVLVKLAHNMGFKVILDWVANHTGWDHVWTVTNPDYFLKDKETGNFKVASGMDDIIELDYGNPSLRKAMIDAMKFWVLETGIDGFRSDLAFWVELGFWKEARNEIEKFKTLFWLAEADPLDNPEYLEVFDAAYTWTWMHKTTEFYKQAVDISLLRSIMNRYDAVCRDHSIPLWFTANHDENSWNGTEYEKYGDMAKLLAVFSFTRNGMPLIYSGQELPNLKRLQFFEKDIIEWKGNYQLYDFYKTLLTLHTNNPALRAADPAAVSCPIQSGNRNIIVFLRKNGDREVLVVLNFSGQCIQPELGDENISGQYRDVFSNDSADNTSINKEIEPWGYRVYEK